jgi:hypothetical protein
MSIRVAMFSILSIASAAAVAQEGAAGRSSGEVALSNDTVELRYVGSGRDVGVGGGSGFSGAFFLSENRDIVLDAGLAFPAFSEGRLTLAVGPQVYAALLDEENNDVFSVTLGAQLRMLLHRASGLAISGRAYYGADILTFGAADNLTDLSARVEIGLAPSVQAFAGMRWFEFDLIEGGGEQTLMEEVFVGAAYRF